MRYSRQKPLPIGKDIGKISKNFPFFARKVNFRPAGIGCCYIAAMNSNLHGLPLRGKALTAATDIRMLPKVLLHEHLDGGLRPQTVIELARGCGYHGLPTEDVAELAAWFQSGAQRGTPAEHMDGFLHTTCVMQTRQALERVAYEFIEDMHEDGVVYAEVRFAPIFHTDMGLTQDEVIEAVLKGLKRGQKTYGVAWGLIICAMRHLTASSDAAELAIRWRDEGVVGFDLAGGEAGFPPKNHVEAFQTIERANFNITIHAGESFGTDYIWQALQLCGAHRLGHATRLKDDMEILPDGTLKLGKLAQYILDRRIPLEMCLLSNLRTGACPSLEEHPFGLFFKRGFRVFLNTDDRLMSHTSMTRETTLAVELFDLSLMDLEKLALNAMKSAFAPYDKRMELIYQTIKPGYLKTYQALISRPGISLSA